MLLFLFSCFSIVFLSSSFLHPFPSWEREMGFRFWEEFSRFLLSWFRKNKNFLDGFFHFSRILAPARKIAGNVETEETAEGISLMDLPDLAVESILERLSAAELRIMAGVCGSLREKCVADWLWERHLRERWGRLIGNGVYAEWKRHVGSRKKKKKGGLLDCERQGDFVGFFARFRGFVLNGRSEVGNGVKGFLPQDSAMALYFSLETGSFSFPAQVYNREVQNGNVGFMLSCYDAEVSYDSSSDLFWARYPAYGRRSVEENIVFDRLRAPPVGTSAYVLHKSDCLNDLKPNDHIEIQWRRSKEFPYGWWYGVVGHSGSCNGSKLHCDCHKSDTVKLEFKQYSPDSEWRETTINRRGHKEVGNEADGYYGGIRKLYSEDEISEWRRFWPSCTLD
nr:F-box protein At2g26850-like isoform X1 [Ipomoea batatas]